MTSIGKESGRRVINRFPEILRPQNQHPRHPLTRPPMVTSVTEDMVTVVGVGNCGPVPVRVPRDQLGDTDTLWEDFQPTSTDEKTGL